MSARDHTQQGPSANPFADFFASIGITDMVQIGRGGFAVVYRGVQADLQREVAVKVLNAPGMDHDTRRRFERELGALGALSAHPGIVTVYDGGVTDTGYPYFVMSHVAGGSLAGRLSASGPFDVPTTLHYGVKLAGALAAAHALGILHRDIKPENILLGDYGPALADFGIARVEGAAESRSGVVTGSLAHAAPEVLDGRRPGPESDVYGLASTLYGMLAGSPPFWQPSDESIQPMIVRILTQPPPDLRGRGVPEALWRVFGWAMAKTPADRCPSALIFGRALQQVQEELGLPVAEMQFVEAHEPAGSAPVEIPAAEAVETPAVTQQPPAASPAAEPRVTVPQAGLPMPPPDPTFVRPKNADYAVAQEMAAAAAAAEIAGPDDNRGRRRVTMPILAGAVLLSMIAGGAALAVSRGTQAVPAPAVATTAPAPRPATVSQTASATSTPSITPSPVPTPVQTTVAPAPPPPPPAARPVPRRRPASTARPRARSAPAPARPRNTAPPAATQAPANPAPPPPERSAPARPAPTRSSAPARPPSGPGCQDCGEAPSGPGCQDCEGTTVSAAANSAGPRAQFAEVTPQQSAQVTRVNGNEPTEISIALSRERFGDGQAAWVVLARRDVFADALAGAPLTAQGPLLLTSSSRLSQSVEDEINRVLPPKTGSRPHRYLYVLGGFPAVSEDVQRRLESLGYTVLRLHGPSRVETALAIAREVRNELYRNAPRQVVLARADAPADNPTAAWADAVTGGAWATMLHVPVLVTQSDSLHPQVAAAIQEFDPERVVLMGGESALSDQVRRAVRRWDPERVSGLGRAETAAAVLDLWREDTSKVVSRFTIVHGFRKDGWAFGLASAGAAAEDYAPILLTDTRDVPGATTETIRSICSRSPQVTLIGDDTVISATAEESIQQALLCR